MPYDRTDPMVEAGGGPPAAGAGPPGFEDPTQGGPPVDASGGLGDPQGGMGLGDLGGGAPGAGTSDQLTGADLAALDQDPGLQSPEDQEVAQLAQMIDDPNTPPEMQQQLQSIMELAARRKMGTMMGVQGLGGQGAQ